MRELPTDKIISCFYDSSEDCIKVLSPDAIIMSFNPKGLEVMEIDDIKDVRGKDWLGFWDGDMHLKAEQALEKAVAGNLSRFEGYCPTFKGTMKYWKVTVAPLFDDFGHVLWLLVISQDITREKELESRVAELEKQLSLK